MKIFKRSELPGAPYYARFQVRGKVYLWSTKADEMTLARARAKAYRAAVLADQFSLVNSMKARGHRPTFAALMKEYLTFPAPGKKTKAINVSGLRLVLAASGLSDTDTLDRVGVGLALKWQQHGVGSHMPVATINSVLRRARSLFSRHAMLLYGDKPDAERVREFFSVPMLREPEGRPELPPDAADRAAHEQLPAIPELWRAYLLARYAGLRAGEIKAAKKDWLDGTMLYVGGKPTEFTPKGRRWRVVALPPEVATTLLASPHDALVGEYPGPEVDRRLPKKLHELGFPKKKPLHSVRRLFGSLVYTTQGPRQARDALGHSTQAVTDRAYCRSLDAPVALAFAAPAA